MLERYMPEDWILPMITEYNRAFFTSLALRLQRCTVCAQVQHPPVAVCRHCQSFDFEYIDALGAGTVENFTIVHYAASTRLEGRVPYNVVIVTLDDYPAIRVVGNVVNAAERSLEIGSRVQCEFTQAVDNDTGITLSIPQWRLVD